MAVVADGAICRQHLGWRWIPKTRAKIVTLFEVFGKVPARFFMGINGGPKPIVREFQRGRDLRGLLVQSGKDRFWSSYSLFEILFDVKRG